jgi:hypothetical protein
MDVIHLVGGRPDAAESARRRSRYFFPDLPDNHLGSVATDMRHTDPDPELAMGLEPATC